MLSLFVPTLLINLLGIVEEATDVVGERTGSPGPCKTEKGDSGPTLDLGLSCSDGGRRDRRRIQEFWDDENESRELSVLFAVATSLGLM